jgi:hypothetical protein
MDTMFYADYNLFSDHSPCRRWWDNVLKYAKDALAAPDSYIGCYAAGAGITYGAIQVKQRREQEAIAERVTVRRGGIVWEDKTLWTSYLSTDAAVNECGLLLGGCVDDWANAAMSRLLNDVVDLGYDWAVGDVGNGILTLADGKTGRDDLARAYRKFASVLNRMGTFRHDTVGGVFNAATHAWQMSDTRHRVIACVMTSDDPGIGPTNVSASWYEAVIQDKPGTKIEHEMVVGVLKGTSVLLTARSWRAISKDPLVGTILYYGHCWIVQKRNENQISTAEEILDVEDILRCACIEAAMEMDRGDFMEAMWCWVIESFCATDLMWHAMIGSTAISAGRSIGSDRWSDAMTMPAWQEQATGS